jgi:hypothetical protein
LTSVPSETRSDLDSAETQNPHSNRYSTHYSDILPPLARLYLSLSPSSKKSFLEPHVTRHTSYT